MVARRTTRIGSAIVVGLAAVIAAPVLYLVHRDPIAPVISKEPVITKSTDKPDESKANADAYTWRGSALEPKRITLPSLGIDAYIQKSGVDQNNQVAVPSNVHLASWFKDSVRPGSKGLSVIAGHVSGKTQPGVFKDLNKLKKGDTFTIIFGDNTQETFRVTANTAVPTAEAANLLFSQDPDTISQLNLITCAGSYSSQDRSYDKRVIVAATVIR